MELVLFTSANGSRACLAAAFFNSLVVPSLAVAIPAVPDPVAKLDPELLGAMKELGPRFTVAMPSRFTTELGAKASLIVYVGIAATALRVDDVPFLEWNVAPSADARAASRVVRDAILRSVEGLLERRGWMRQERARTKS